MPTRSSPSGSCLRPPAISTCSQCEALSRRRRWSRHPRTKAVRISLGTAAGSPTNRTPQARLRSTCGDTRSSIAPGRFPRVGGVQVRWSRASNEIFYRANQQQIVAVPFDGSGTSQSLASLRRFLRTSTTSDRGSPSPNYDVTNDGRFLMLRRGAQGGTLRVILNWTEELKRAIDRGGVR